MVGIACQLSTLGQHRSCDPALTGHVTRPSPVVEFHSVHCGVVEVEPLQLQCQQVWEPCKLQALREEAGQPHSTEGQLKLMITNCY